MCLPKMLLLVVKGVAAVLVMWHNRMQCNDLPLALSEETTVNAPQRSVVLAGGPGAISCIQFRKLAFIYIVCVCKHALET